MDDKKSLERESTRKLTLLAAAGGLVLWLAQPPFALWLAALIALVPWLYVVCYERNLVRRDYLRIWMVGSIYWAISLEGLRHAHPLIYPCWIVLGAYLGVYFAAFVLISRRMLRRKIPLWVAAPAAWVGVECIRNYMVTGLSAAMLGHTMADVPMMIQIADIFGSYGVSFVIVCVNVAIFYAIGLIRKNAEMREAIPAFAVAAVALLATLWYGNLRLQEKPTETLSTFALIQRSEPVEYSQNEDREIEIFYSYQQQSIAAVAGATVEVHAVVWPESMFTGGMPLMLTSDATVPSEESGMSFEEFRFRANEFTDAFSIRAGDFQVALANVKTSRSKPHIIAGCGVLDYRERPYQHSGVVHVDPSSSVSDWYGKTHLVMFGEYAPVLNWIPGLENMLPHLDVGPGPKTFAVNGTLVSPNVCIETAVERVTVNQLAQLNKSGRMPDVVVTVTNDGWFDQSSVVDHHLRCAQLVAVGCRRPVLSSANNGPTAWIDSSGQVVQRMPVGGEGAIIATPTRDERLSVYLQILDWPARILALLCGLFLVDAFRWRNEGASGEESTRADS